MPYAILSFCCKESFINLPSKKFNPWHFVWANCAKTQKQCLFLGRPDWAEGERKPGSIPLTRGKWVKSREKHGSTKQRFFV